MALNRKSYIEEPLFNQDDIIRLFNPNDGITIFEIGACEGEDSIKYARLFPNSRIYAFEPLPGNFEIIEGNLAKYDVKNVYPHNKALSLENGVAEFFVSEETYKPDEADDWNFGNKSSSLLPPENHTRIFDFVKFDHKIEVETITLDSFCKENNIAAIDFIHLDAQGAELMVLKGAGRIITSIKAIWLEVSTVHIYKDQPLVDDIHSFMEANDFVLLKDYLEEIQGDRLYVSKKYFPNYKKLLQSNTQSVLSKFIYKFRNRW